MANTVRLYFKEPMSASLTSVPVDCRGYNKVSFHNRYGAGANGNFTYEFTNNPVVLGNADDADAGWIAVTPSTTHGTQPNGGGAGQFGVVFVDGFRFVRQKWTRTAGAATDLLTTNVDLDNG